MALAVGALAAGALACAGTEAARLRTVEPPLLELMVPAWRTDPGGAAVELRGLEVIDEDWPRALAQARAEHKLLLVEAWAPWCHTCLSMKHYVLTDPALASLAEHVVVVAIDTDQGRHAGFLERYQVQVWPTLFVIDPAPAPAVDPLLAHWQGAASPLEIQDLVHHALAKRESGAWSGPSVWLVAGQRALAEGEYALAAQDFERAVDHTIPSWPRRSEALLGWLSSEYRQEHWQRCAELGVERIDEVQGAAVPTDFCYVLLACAGKLDDSPLRQRARERALERLRRHTAAFPQGASVDDRADALGLLARTLREGGQLDAARRTTERQLTMLESAARGAADPAQAATFDYARMRAYLALDRGDEAVRMLRERTSQRPEAYEPRGRLAETLMALERWSEALAAIDGAIERSYGPRQLCYRRMQADILGRLGRDERRRAALAALLRAYEALPSSTRQSKRLRVMVDAVRVELGPPPG